MISPEKIKKLAKSVIETELKGARSLTGQINDNFVKTAKKLLECKGHVLITGVGTSNHIAARFAHLLTCCGTPALFIHPGDSQHGLAGAVGKNDVVIAISKGGQTAEVLHLAWVARDRGATLISITENPGSELAKMSDIILLVKAPKEVDPFGMIATGSSLMTAAFCDAVCVVMLNLRGYTLKEFAATHPGGAVGRKLKEKKLV